MKNFLSQNFSAAIVAATVIPSAAFADLSGAEVWESWKAFAEASGQSVSVGSQDTNGDTLTLNDVQMTMEFPEGSASSTIEFLEFRDRSDGTVAVTMAPDVPFSITVDPTEGEALDLAMIMRQTGASIVASGDPDAMTFDYLAAELSVAVDMLVVDGADTDVDIRFALADLDGKYALTSGEIKSYSSDMTAENMSYTVNFIDPEEGGRFVMNGSVDGLQSNSMVDLPEDFDATDPAALFGGDFNVQGGLSAGTSKSEMSLSGVAESFSIATSSQSSKLDFAVLDGSVQYGGNVKEVTYALSSPQIPFPEVNLAFAEAAFNFLMPLAQSDEPQDFALLIKLAGMEISDMIWSMFDPGGIMPRDPATIALDVSGQMNWLVDITDPDVALENDIETPAELYDLKINEITLSAIGAEITGGGDFTFDNSNLDTFDGLPAPTGQVDMSIVGVNGVMDRLIQMGFLAQDQAMGARMMLGLFARPGDGEDTMTSNIEVRGDGSVFANGQQLR